MKLITKRLKKLTLVSVAAYVFMFAVCAKGVYFYANQHPLKEELRSIHGIIKDVRLGGQGMGRIQSGDRIELLAERSSCHSLYFWQS